MRAEHPPDRIFIDVQASYYVTFPKALLLPLYKQILFSALRSQTPSSYVISLR